MRCDNCEYCEFDGWEGYWYCALHLPYEDDRNGDSGCKYNKRTLDKKYKAQQKWIAKCEEEE